MHVREQALLPRGRLPGRQKRRNLGAELAAITDSPFSVAPATLIVRKSVTENTSV